jgi:hypothetical protein
VGNNSETFDDAISLLGVLLAIPAAAHHSGAA